MCPYFYYKTNLTSFNMCVCVSIYLPQEYIPYTTLPYPNLTHLSQERARAVELGYEDPVNPSFEATTQMYHDCLEECLRRIKFNKSFGDTQKV